MRRMAKRAVHTVGLTRDAGFQIGVRRTLPVAADEAWDLVTSRRLVRRWLGAGRAFRLEEGACYRLDDGSTGEVRVVSPASHVRLTMLRSGSSRPSTIQVRTIGKGDAAVVAFHEEHLPGPREREERRAHYTAVLDDLQNMLEG